MKALLRLTVVGLVLSFVATLSASADDADKSKVQYMPVNEKTGELAMAHIKIINEDGALEADNSQKPPVLKVDSKPRHKAAAILITPAKGTDASGKKTVVVELRLVSPDSLKRRQFYLSARREQKWLKPAFPDRLKEDVKAGEWTELRFDVSHWDWENLAYLRLYHSNIKVEPEVYEIRRVWAE